MLIDNNGVERFGAHYLTAVIVALLCLLVACGEPQTAVGDGNNNADVKVTGTDDNGESKQAPPPADWYATAMQRHKPLGRVTGDLKPLADAGADDGRFDAVMTYAEAQQSYSLLIWQGGKLVLEHYFPPYTADLRPESASMHKSVLALVVAAAIADGFINSADDRIGDYIKPWSGDVRGDITLRQLLTMSAGLKPLDREGGMQSEAVSYWMNGANARRTLLNLQPEHEPGTVFYYQVMGGNCGAEKFTSRGVITTILKPPPVLRPVHRIRPMIFCSLTASVASGSI